MSKLTTNPRFAALTGLLLALALAVAKYAPILAAPIEWQP